VQKHRHVTDLVDRDNPRRVPPLFVFDGTTRVGEALAVADLFFVLFIVRGASPTKSVREAASASRAKATA